MSIAPTGAAGSTPSPTGAPSSTGTSKTTEDKDMFMKLLVAQIKYQDPMNPQNGLDFMNQTAQYTVIEKLSELSDQNTKILQTSQSLASSSMVGKTVTATDTDGTDVTGKVDKVKIDPTNGVTVVIGNKEFLLAKVKEIGS